MFLQICNYKKISTVGRLIVISYIIAFFSFKVFAQNNSETGVISGSVLDAEYGGFVSAARVNLAGTAYSTTTNLNGKYSIRNIPIGEYKIMVSADFYKLSLVEELIITANGVTRLDIPIYGDDSNIIELDAFTVQASILQISDIGLLASRKKSPAVGDAIGSETFARLGLGNAAEVMGKITGTSVVDGKYIVVRGLSDRYNSTTLNGTTIPSADPYKKAVQLDQFPASLIDVIKTIKTATPDKPGDFTGGSVNIETKSFPDSFFVNVSSGISFNSNTYGKNYLTYKGGGKDSLAYDDGSRAIPDAAVGVLNLAELDSKNQDKIVREFSPEVSATVKSGDFSHSHSISTGNSVRFGEQQFGYVAALTYKRNYSADSDSLENRYRTLRRGRSGDWQLYRERELQRDVGLEEVNIGFTVNGAYQWNDNNEVGVRGFFSRSGIDEAVFVDGLFDDSDEFFLRENRLHYTERSIDSVQFYGDHKISSFGGSLIEWSYSDSSSSQDEPDFRLFYDALSLSDLDDPKPSSYFFPTGLRNWRLFRELSESTTDFSVDVTKSLSFSGMKRSSIKVGFKNVKGDRDYLEQTFGYRTKSPVPYDGQPSNYLSDANIGIGSDGRLLRVIATETTLIPRYIGSRNIKAYYLMFDLVWNDKVRTVFGARKESTDIEVSTFDFRDNQLANGLGGIEEADLLPSMNFIWSLAEKQNIRVAYSKTLARPNYRELSPVPTFTAIGGFSIVGNADLERSMIDNMDVRWEWFKGEGQIFTIGAFQKNIKNPIEQSFSSSAQTTYLNVDKGEVRGLEFETRHYFKELTGDSSRISIGGNYAFIDSEVTRSKNELSAKRIFDPEISETRELQGQSPYVLNADMTYEHFTKGIAVTLSYNSIGERLYEVSQAQLPDVYEKVGDSLDLIVIKRFGETWKLKFKAGNLMDEEKRRYHYFLDDEKTYSSSKSGITYSLGFSYNFN